MPTRTASPRPRGEYAKSARRREEIVQAATSVFASAGFRGSSLRDIAEHIGMSQQGLTYHFPTKDDLLAAVLRARGERDGAFLHAHDGDPQAQLRAVLDLVEHNQSTPGLVELYCTLSAEATAADHPAHRYFQQRYAAVVADTTSSFEQLQARGQLLAGVEPGRAARGLIALMDGLQVQWLLSGRRIDMVADLRAHLRLITPLDLR